MNNKLDIYISIMESDTVCDGYNFLTDLIQTWRCNNHFSLEVIQYLLGII